MRPLRRRGSGGAARGVGRAGGEDVRDEGLSAVKDFLGRHERVGCEPGGDNEGVESGDG